MENQTEVNSSTSTNQVNTLASNQTPSTSSSSTLTFLQMLDRITINLKILSELKPHDKLVFRDGIFDIDRWDYTQPFRRWYNADSRQSTIENLNNFINSVFSFIEEIYLRENISINDNESTKKGKRRHHNVFSEESNQTLLSISHNLQNATSGIRNLIVTYENDTLVSKKLQHFISNIEARVQRINNLMILNTGGTETITRQPMFQSYHQNPNSQITQQPQSAQPVQTLTSASSAGNLVSSPLATSSLIRKRDAPRDL